MEEPQHNLAIEVKDLSKTFHIVEDRKETLKALVSAFFKQGRTRSFKALDDINFNVRKGEFVGVIGRNGSGKSTLLKIIAGIYNPDPKSKVVVHGRLVPFLELGVGFNADLSGKENIYLNGTILGMTKKFLDQKFDEIVEFAELQEFIETPVKNYSSGMQVRLAFAVAIQTDADIFILDEVLAVGDAGFQQKSMAKIKELKTKGKTVLFVSHSMHLVKTICDRAILIDNHMIKADGNPETVTKIYEKMFNQNPQ